MQYAIVTDALRRRFGKKMAVDGLDMKVRAGAVTGFLGPNGAGKTTTVRMLLGLLRPTGGSVEVLGCSLPGQRRMAARQVGALVETPSHYEHLTGEENLEITRRLLGLDRSECGRVLELVELSPAAREKVAGYSLGMRQRLGIARAMLGSPKLLILDEPTNGLDPDGIVAMRNLIRALPAAAGMTVFLSSHLLAEVEQTVDDVAVLWNGRLVAEGALADLLALSQRRLIIQTDDRGRAAELLVSRELSLTARRDGAIEVVGGRYLPAAINAALVGAGISVSELRLEQPTLESLYLSLTGRSAPAFEAA